jgi:hypothetical protein
MGLRRHADHAGHDLRRFGGMFLTAKFEPLIQKPWERPPIPTIGDPDVEHTYAGVGHVTSEWENIELTLADLFSLFVGNFQHPSAVQGYGVRGVFKNRAENLRKAATAYFQAQPTQLLEGELDELMQHLLEYAQRRHDVAHGIVKSIQHSRSPHAHEEGDPLTWVLVPPDYKGKDYFAEQPAYAYTRAEMDIIANSLSNASFEVTDYIMKLQTTAGGS